MVFSSPIFLFGFLPFVLTLYLVAPRSVRNALLLVASLLFYAWGETVFVVALIGSALVNHSAGLAVDALRGRPAAKWVLGLAVAANLGLLGFFKYANFLADNLSPLLEILGSKPLHLSPIHLPIGISFFTFQALSYVVDIYRSDAPPQKNPALTTLYIALFPQLIAGPIVRYHDISGQLRERTVRLGDLAYGVQRFIVGLAKKILIADVVGRSADAVFAVAPGELSAGVAWVGVVAYTLQIYFDFSAYSDMAIGLGRIFGFRFLENFRYPYISESIREFWRRWHISLSSWFRDYLYIPLGGNRHGPRRTYFALVTVFLLCGLWHGASWSFVVWGLYHGIFLVLERTALVPRRWPRPLRHLYVLMVVMIGWVFFRAEDLGHALTYLAAMVGLGGADRSPLTALAYLPADVALAMVAGIIGSAPLWPSLQTIFVAWNRRQPMPGRDLHAAAWELATGLSLATLFLASVLRLAAGTYSPFLYFRF